MFQNLTPVAIFVLYSGCQNVVMTSRLRLAGAQSLKMQSAVVATPPPMIPLQRANTGNMPTREFAVVMPSLDRDGLKLENHASETSDSGNFSPDPTPNSIWQNYSVRSPSSDWSPWFKVVLPPVPSVLASTVQPRASSPNLCLTYNATVRGQDSGGSWQRSKNVSQSLPSSRLSMLRRQAEADESRNFFHRRRASLHSLTHDAWPAVPWIEA